MKTVQQRCHEDQLTSHTKPAGIGPTRTTVLMVLGDSFEGDTNHPEINPGHCSDVQKFPAYVKPLNTGWEPHAIDGFDARTIAILSG